MNSDTSTTPVRTTAWTVARSHAAEHEVDEVDPRRGERRTLEDHEPADDREGQVERLVGEEQHPRPRRPGAAQAGCGNLAGALHPGARLDLGLLVGAPRGLDLPAVHEHVRDRDDDEVHEAGQPEREHRREEAQRHVEPVGEERPAALVGPLALVQGDPVVLQDEVREEMREDQPAQHEDGVAHAALPDPDPDGSAPCARSTPWRNSVAIARASPWRWRTPAAVRDHRDRRPRDVESLGRLGAPQLVDEDEPADLALAGGQVREQRRQQRPEIAEQGVRLRVAGDGDEAPIRPVFARASTSRAAWKAGPVRSVAGPVPASTGPATIAQRRSRASVWSAARSTARNGSTPGASSPWTSSPWVNPKAASRSPARIGGVEIGSERAEPGRCARVAPRVDHVAEQDRAHGRCSHPREPTRCVISHQGLI